jgi:shikimate kinase
VSSQSGIDYDELRKALGARTVVLVGLMGSGKSSVGKRFASKLGLPFRDADTEIETAANMSIAEIFENHGEASFRSGEARVIARLLTEGPQVLATGGGAWMNEETRTATQESGISIWLDGELDVLMERVSRRSHRPLLQNADPRGTMQKLMNERNPVYALADTRVESRAVPHEIVVQELAGALKTVLDGADD